MDQKSTNNDKKRNKVLFDFEALVDMKISYLISYTDRNDSLEELKFRRMYDTTSILDGIEVKQEDYDHPKKIIFTCMKTLLETYHNMTDEIRPKVLCKDEYQERIIKQYFPWVPVITAPRDKVNTLHFTRIILGDVKQTLEFTDPVTVDFFILGYRENFSPDDDSLLPKEILLQVGDVNSFTIVRKPFLEIQDPVG